MTENTGSWPFTWLSRIPPDEWDLNDFTITTAGGQQGIIPHPNEKIWTKPYGTSFKSGAGGLAKVGRAFTKAFGDEDAGVEGTMADEDIDAFGEGMGQVLLDRVLGHTITDPGTGEPLPHFEDMTAADVYALLSGALLTYLYGKFAQAEIYESPDQQVKGGAASRDTSSGGKKTARKK